MKVNRFVFFVLFAQSLAGKGMTSVQNSPVLNPENFFCNSFSKGNEKRVFNLFI